MRFLIFFILLFSSFFSFSQGVKLDIDFNDLNKGIEEDDLVLTRSIINQPSSYNLKRFLPYTHNQGNIGMCVAYAFTTCRSILYARDNNLENIDEISYESFSPHFTYIYNKINQKDTLSEGMYYDIESIEQSGFVKIRKLEFPNYYPFSSSQIFSFPNLNSFEKLAKKNKFSKIKYIFIDGEKKKAKKIKKIKDNLLNNNPSVLSFKVWPENLNEKSDVWDLINIACIDSTNDCNNLTNDISGLCKLHKPKYWDLGYGHAVTLIGYDDNLYGGSFLIHNSHGNDFGDNGNMWISYNNFFDNVEFVFTCYTNRVKDFGSVISKNLKGFSSLPVDRTEDFKEYLNFDWSAKLPIINKLGSYDGDYSLSLRDGLGSFTSFNNVIYNGRWKDDLPNGHGLLILNNGQIIDAVWNGVKIPKSIRISDQNIIYDGEWNSILSLPNGKGKLVFLDSSGIFNSALEGNFNNNYIPDDPYTYFFSDSSKYTGEWKGNMLHGYGTYEWPDGTKYIGEFKDNLFHGKGKQIDTDGNIQFDGLWKNDNFVE